MNDHLAIFDIDGTLTATNAVDDECYCEAAADLLGVTSTEIDWSEAPHVTDSAIADYLWKRYRHRSPTVQEISQLQQRFIALLEMELARAPDRFAPIGGANEVVACLTADGWTVAIATGGWYKSAAMKLRVIGLSSGAVAVASADDAHSREEILQLAQRRAETRPGGQFRVVVSVGDAPWDVRTAYKLGLPFVGVGSGSKVERLRAAGAAVVLADLAYEPLLQALIQARVPVPDGIS